MQETTVRHASEMLPAAHLAARGESLKAGQIVMTGSVMKTIFPAADASYGFSLNQIGNVSVTVR